MVERANGVSLMVCGWVGGLQWNLEGCEWMEGGGFWGGHFVRLWTRYFNPTFSFLFHLGGVGWSWFDVYIKSLSPWGKKATII